MANSTSLEAMTLGGIMTYFKDNTNCITKGELKYKSNFVLDVRLVDMNVNAKVRASMKDKSYRTQLTVNGTGEIIKSSCDFPRGNWLCSHMAATAIFINKHGVSKTDLPNSWITKPK